MQVKKISITTQQAETEMQGQNKLGEICSLCELKKKKKKTCSYKTTCSSKQIEPFLSCRHEVLHFTRTLWCDTNHTHSLKLIESFALKECLGHHTLNDLATPKCKKCEYLTFRYFIYTISYLEGHSTIPILLLWVWYPLNWYHQMWYKYQHM